ncbi:acetyl-CoA synthetase-like protein [Epithele typhae]|uniref:acetyl-CoA synthetase-like protein n=1 Tax=Epithele typhae TaxID=378194 RepID=UPI002008A569|nr:acetyl-CoA synthetase-like protein [Epithele typhae]KAH9917682.1 acetyl-CoA synthetase-like protein [Epithele typhae]
MASDDASLANHYVSYLAAAFAKHADAAVFRPYVDRTDFWPTVTYRELNAQLAAAKEHWKVALAPLGLTHGDVVGCWFTGRRLADFVNSTALSALGFVPQFFGGYFPSADSVLLLLERGGGKALVVDPSLAAPFAEHPSTVPRFSPLAPAELDTLAAARPLDEWAFGADRAVRLDDVAILFHSSGTTAGLPKIIPNTFRMLRSVLEHKFSKEQLPSRPGVQVCYNTIGSLANIGSYQCLIGAINLGGCVAQSSSMLIPPAELLGLVRECKITILVLYAPFLSALLRPAMADPELEGALLTLHQITHTGVALNKDDEDWAYAHGLNINTSYGTTETGPLMWSRLGSAPADRAMRPIRGTRPVFLPQTAEASSVDAKGVELFECAIPADAEDCPPGDFCGADGFYHTGDLFERRFDGWVYRGRAGDWIRLQRGFCDTKSVEDFVRSACKDVIHDVVVLGTARPLAFWAVEVPREAPPLTEEEKGALKKEVLARTSEFNKTLFQHERVLEPKQVFVVEKGVLPRTKEKGNIRRAVTEELFQAELDALAPKN